MSVREVRPGLYVADQSGSIYQARVAPARCPMSSGWLKDTQCVLPDGHAGPHHYQPPVPRMVELPPFDVDEWPSTPSPLMAAVRAFGRYLKARWRGDE